MLRWRIAPVLLALAAAAVAAGVAWAGAPLSATPPVVVGDPVPGSTLTCDPGTWEDLIDGSQPLVAWVVDGAQSAWGVAEELTLALAEGDLGKRIACKAQASNIEGSSTAVSAEVVVVRCTAAMRVDLQETLQRLEGERAAAQKRLARAQAAYRKLLFSQAKAKQRFFSGTKDAGKRKAFLARQAAARAKAKKAVAAAGDARDLAGQALEGVRQRLAACGRA